MHTLEPASTTDPSLAQWRACWPLRTARRSATARPSPHRRPPMSSARSSCQKAPSSRAPARLRCAEPRCVPAQQRALFAEAKRNRGRAARQVAVDEQAPAAAYSPDWFGMMLGPFSKVRPFLRCTCTLHACAGWSEGRSRPLAACSAAGCRPASAAAITTIECGALRSCWESKSMRWCRGEWRQRK